MLIHEIRVRNFPSPLSNKFVVRYYVNGVLSTVLPQDYSETVANSADFILNVPINLSTLNLEVTVRIFSDNVLSGKFVDKSVTLNQTCGTTTTLPICTTLITVTGVTSITDVSSTFTYTGSATSVTWAIKNLSNQTLRSGTGSGGTINATYTSLPQGDYIVSISGVNCVSIGQQLFTINSGSGVELSLGTFEFGGKLI
jgi:hypothetical protein